MLKILFLILAITGGFMVGLQAPVNAALGKRVGGIEGALVSFSVGTVFLLIATFTIGKGSISEVINVPKWQLIGGFLGAVFVTISIIAVPKLGVATALLAVIVGQIIAGMIIDNFGFFGTARIPFDWYRFIGVVFLFLGLILIMRGNFSS